MINGLAIAALGLIFTVLGMNIARGLWFLWEHLWRELYGDWLPRPRDRWYNLLVHLYYVRCAVTLAKTTFGL